MKNSPKLDQDYPNVSRSEALAQRVYGLIPAFTQTLAKGPTQYVDGVAPKFLSEGSGCRVRDLDGNEYIDLTMGVGPLVLGHRYPAVDAAIREQLARGITFSLPHPLEVDVAELVRHAVPGADMVRFSKTGCDVTSAAVRLARACTGRNKVLCSGYHGWHDWYVATTPRRAGVPARVGELTTTFAYDDLDAVTRLLDGDVAAVILEPVQFQEPKGRFLQELRRLCTRNGSLLIFDEMWTGFRLALGGAQEHYDVQADLACFSKAVANGMPLSVLTGRCDLMQRLNEDVFFFTTFGGEALSLAAARATLEELRERDVPRVLAERGARLRDGYNRVAAELGLGFTYSEGPDCRSRVVFEPAREEPLLVKSFVQQELLRHGVLWSGFHNVAFSHMPDDVEHVLAAYRRVLVALRDALGAGDLRARLRGKPLEPVFRVR